MRRSFQGTQFMFDDNNNFVGVSLGADYCAEHEWGIEELKNMFGLPNNCFEKKIFGIEARRNSQVQNLYFSDIPRVGSLLICYRSWNENITINELYKQWKNQLYFGQDENLVCTWDSKSFAILVKKENKKYLEELYNAFQKKDIAFGLGKSNPFGGGGLIITIISKLPKNVLKEMKQEDEDYYNLQKAAEKTGIYDILKKAGKKYFALSPRWKDETKKEVIFWLNPMQQHIHNFGWFSVDTLKLWAKDQGPIMMKK